MLTADREKLAHNLHAVLDRCRNRGVEITVVTKVASADPDLVRVLWEAGATSFGDSRLLNIRRIKDEVPGAERVLLRMPLPGEAEEVVGLCNVSLNSEMETIQALERAAAACGVTHQIILMVDVGDLREGILPGEAGIVARELRHLRNIQVRGIGTNLACYGGIRPSSCNMEELLDTRDVIAGILQTGLPVVSGGNSANWLLMEAGDMPAGVNHLRVGEAIFLGLETVGRTPIEGLYGDVFNLWAGVIESRVKPSRPQGQMGQDSFGQMPEIRDRGLRRRAIVAIGRQDVVPGGLEPMDPGIEIVGASSDHMILDVHDSARPPAVGDVLGFRVHGYSALLALYTSGYVEKMMIR